MLALLGSIISGTLYVYTLKITEVKNCNRYAATLFNYIMAIVLSVVTMKHKVLFYDTPDGYFAMGFSIFSGICMVAGMIYSRKCISANGAPMQTTFYKLGILIPMAMSFILFSEIPTTFQVIGIVIVVIGVVYMNTGSGDTHITSIPLLILVFVFGGLVEFNFKLYGIYGDIEIKEYYLFLTFIVSAIISWGLMRKNQRSMTKTDVLLGFLTGIPNYFISFFLILALAQVPTYIAYPMNCVGTILMVSLVNVLIFKEYPTKRELKATAIILLALIFLNI